jgi:hypothetical protein
LPPLPVKEPYQLECLVQIAPPLGARSSFTYNTYPALAERAESVDVFAYHEANAAARDAFGAHSARCQIVSGTFFTFLGVRLPNGGILTPADELGTSGVRRWCSAIGPSAFLRGYPAAFSAIAAVMAALGVFGAGRM